MKRSLFAVVFFLFFGTVQGLFPVQITDYSYQLNNGIRVTVENGWRRADVVQEITDTGAFVSNGGAVHMDIAYIGDLAGDKLEIVLYPSSKPKNGVKLAAGADSSELKKGKYTVSVRIPLQSGNGTISFKVGGIDVKENSLTLVRVTLNDIQLEIVEQPGDGGKLGEYQFVTSWAKGKMEGGGYTGYPTVFKAKDRYQMITPVEIESDTKAKIRPGVYDFYLDTDISKAKYRYTCWIENVKIDSNTSYEFRFNLNGALVRTQIDADNPKQIGFYPVGTAATQKPRENKKLKLYTVTEPWKSAVCPTGIYDVLLSFDYGARNEWRTNVVMEYGQETVIK